MWERPSKALVSEADNKYTMIHSTIIRVHQYSDEAL